MQKNHSKNIKESKKIILKTSNMKRQIFKKKGGISNHINFSLPTGKIMPKITYKNLNLQLERYFLNATID